MATKDYLKISDCDFPPAKKFPGKKYRQNPTGSIEFETKREWVENEALIWYEHMKNHPKQLSTEKLTVSNSI
jgi:hypothetical protein